VFETLEPKRALPVPLAVFAVLQHVSRDGALDARSDQAASGVAGGIVDLIVLAYQAWFLSPSQPMTASCKAPMHSHPVRETGHHADRVP